MSARVATTANITLDNTTTTVDGVTIANGDLVLVKNQTTGTQNGLYVASTTGAWSRSPLLPVGANAFQTTYYVTSGTVNAKTNFECVITPAVVGTNSLVIMPFDNALLNNLSATTAPTVTDDNTKGYAVGSVWINTSTNMPYTCTNSGTGVAVWSQGGTGDVVGPASSTDKAITRFNGTTGKSVQNSTVTISDAAVVAGIKTLTMTDSTTNTISITPATTTTTYSLTLPGAQGGSGSVLTNNGSGVLSWGTTIANLSGTTTDTVPYQSASATTSYYTYNQLNGALTGASATQTIFLSNLNGSDTYNGLSPQTSVATLAKALTLVASGGIIKVNRSGTPYSESVSITPQNITIMSDAYNGAVAFSGTITVANTASNVSMKGLSIATLVHSGAGALYLYNCYVTTAFSTTSSGFFQAYDSDFQGSGAVTVSVTGTGTKIFGANCYLGATTINNASAVVGMYNINNSLPVTVTAGLVSINAGVVYSASAGANALSVASGGIAYLQSVNFTVLGTVNPALINIASGAFYSELGVSRSASSTISGTNLARLQYYDNLNSLTTALRGSTSGTLTIRPAATTTSYTVTMPSAQGGATTVLQNDGSGGLSWATVSSGGSSSALVYAYYSTSSSGTDGSNRVEFTPTPVINTDTSQISMSGNILTLAAGTWELRGFVQCNTGSIAYFRFFNETTPGFVGQNVLNFGSTGASSGNICTYSVTLSTSRNFSFRFESGSFSSIVTSSTYLIVEKKSSTPINPSPEYMVANLSANQTTNVSSGDHIKFNGLWNGNMSSSGTTTTDNISLDTTTAYVTTNNVASIGRFTLGAGRTYELTASLSATSGSGGFAWFNANTGTQLSNEAKLLDNLQCIAKAIVTPSSSTRYEVRLTQTGPTTYHSSSAFAEVRIIGALPNGSNFAGSTPSAAGSQGLVPAPPAARDMAELRGNATWVNNNYSASAAPAVSNDTTQGYGVGSRWTNGTQFMNYQCVRSTSGQALWYPQPVLVYSLQALSCVSNTSVAASPTFLNISFLTSTGGTTGFRASENTTIDAAFPNYSGGNAKIEYDPCVVRSGIADLNLLSVLGEGWYQITIQVDHPLDADDPVSNAGAQGGIGDFRAGISFYPSGTVTGISWGRRDIDTNAPETGVFDAIVYIRTNALRFMLQYNITDVEHFVTQISVVKYV